MVVKLNNGAVREIKKAEPMVEKRYEFNGNSYRMIAKANSNKEDITGVMFKFNNDRDDNMSVFAVNEENVFVGNLQYDEVQKILDSLLVKGYADMSVYDYQSKISAIVDTVFDEGMTKPYCLSGFLATANMDMQGFGNNFCMSSAFGLGAPVYSSNSPFENHNTEDLIGGKPSHSGEYEEDINVIYQMMNGRISKKTFTKMIKAYYMCAQNGVVYKGYTELTGDNLSYVRRYISGKCADRKIDSKNIDEGCGTDELDMVWLNDSLLLIAGKDAVVQGRTLNRAFYRLPVNNEADKKSADVKNTIHNKMSNNDFESVKPERIFAGNVAVLKIARTSEGSNEPVDIIDEDIEFIESVLRPIERIYAGVVYLKKEKDLGQKSVD